MLVKFLHDKFVYNRRMRMLSEAISGELPPGTSVLDVGCGDGKIDALIMAKTAVTIHGVDVLIRDKTHIPACKYDGSRLPYEDHSFDTVMFIDVLHHVSDPLILLREALRVAKGSVVIKDHLCGGGGEWLAYATLKFMDYFGNAHYGVNLPYNYLSERQWNDLFARLNLVPQTFRTKLRLYPFPFSLLFDRRLHFIARLSVPTKT